MAQLTVRCGLPGKVTSRLPKSLQLPRSSTRRKGQCSMSSSLAIPAVTTAESVPADIFYPEPTSMTAGDFMTRLAKAQQAQTLVSTAYLWI